MWPPSFNGLWRQRFLYFEFWLIFVGVNSGVTRTHPSSIGFIAPPSRTAAAGTSSSPSHNRTLLPPSLILWLLISSSRIYFPIKSLLRFGNFLNISLLDFGEWIWLWGVLTWLVVDNINNLKKCLNEFLCIILIAWELLRILNFG